MKSKTVNSKIFLAGLLMIVCCQYKANSQIPASASGNYKKVFIDLSVGPSHSQILNAGTLTLSGIKTGSNSSLSGSVEIGYLFSKSVGLSTGLGFSSYGADLSIDSCYTKLNEIDSENESYEQRVKGSKIKEHQSISFLEIPLYLRFQIPFTEKFGFFIRTGADLTIPVGKSYNSSGTFTYTAFYPAYNVVLQNIPAHGLVNNTLVKSNGNLDLKTIGAGLKVSAGFQYSVTEKIQIAVGATYYRSLMNISNYVSDDTFQLSPNMHLINSVMSGTSKATVQSTGLLLSVRYYLN